jgi:putative transposase
MPRLRRKHIVAVERRRILLHLYQAEKSAQPTLEIQKCCTNAPMSAMTGCIAAFMMGKLRALADENDKLKRLLADTMLDNVVLKDLLGKN